MRDPEEDEKMKRLFIIVPEGQTKDDIKLHFEVSSEFMDSYFTTNFDFVVETDIWKCGVCQSVAEEFRSCTTGLREVLQRIPCCNGP